MHDCMDMAYPDHWIGHEELVQWSPRSPDITPLDFFLMEQSQGIGVSRRRNYTNGPSCSSACHLYFGGRRVCET
ncbi:uncharacterized protein TNCV_4891501 [Trichonephila clavipes]|nr:uncharacterized protein TNCV_4891501 [Trichonephila clavipes]